MINFNSEIKRFDISLVLAFIIFSFLQTSLLKAQDTTLLSGNTKQELMTVHSSVSLGKDIFNHNYNVYSLGFDYNKKVNDRTRFFAGGNLFNITMTRPLQDKAPKNIYTGAVYTGVSYQANKNLTVAGDVFYNGIYNMVGADLDLKYNFSENSFFEISFSFARQLSASGYNQPVPYWYNEAFHPFILGY